MSNVPPPPIPQPVNYMPAQQMKTDGVSIASLVTGILGFCIPGLGIVGIILGAIGLKRTGRPGVGGRGLAIAGLVCGICGTFMILVQISILLPSLNRARETANRVKCASNLKQIGMGMLLYANENQNAYPPDLAALLATQDLVPAVFVCPSSDSTALTMGGPTTALFTDDVSARAAGNLDYVFVGETLNNNAPAEEPIIFECLTDHNQDGGNVLFADGHVEFFGKAAYLKLVNALRGTPRLTQEEYDAITGK